MNRLRNIIIIASYFLIAAVFFFGGYALGGLRDMAAEDMRGSSAEAVNLTAEDSREFYRLTIENGRLDLYRINGAVKELIAFEDISEGVFPADDIRELEKGVDFDSLSEAQSLFENFVS